MNQIQAGGCLCGKIRFQATVDEQTTAGHCQCRDCQRSTGSAMSTFCIVNEKNLQLMQGELQQHTLKAASGRSVTRSFCGDCGAPILSTGEAMPGLVLVKAGSFDNGDWIQPSLLFWQSTAPAWGIIGDEVACMATNP